MRAPRRSRATARMALPKSVWVMSSQNNKPTTIDAATPMTLGSASDMSPNSTNIWAWGMSMLRVLDVQRYSARLSKMIEMPRVTSNTLMSLPKPRGAIK